MAQLKSTSVMGNLAVTGNVVASNFIKSNGLTNQFLMADGHVESAQEFKQDFILDNKDILGVNHLQLKSENFNDLAYNHIYVGGADNFIKYRTKTQFIQDLKLSQVYNYKGTLADLNALKSIESARVGDVYFISATSDSWACKTEVTSATGTNYETYWNNLGQNVNLSGYMTLDTNQTISGQKTFSVRIIANDAVSAPTGKYFTQNGGYQVLDTYNVFGTTNRIPKFTSTNTIGDSNITDNGTLITLNIPTQLNDTLYLNKTTDAAPANDNRPALIIGNVDGEHLEFDGNEIIAKDNATTQGELFLNLDGGRTVVGGDFCYRNGTNTIIPAIRFFTGTNDGYAMTIGAGGYTGIGSGESAKNLYDALQLNATTEQLHLSSDNAIYLHSNCNAIGSRKTLTLQTDGNLLFPINQGIVRTTTGASWHLARNDAAIKYTTRYSGDSSTYSPIYSYIVNKDASTIGDISHGILHTNSSYSIHWSFATTENYQNNNNVHDSIVEFTSAGQVRASSFNATSDARLKENFQTFIPQKSILDLPVYKFDFINGLKNQIGCKAQDLQEICPEIVDENSDGYLSIQESKIVYLLIDEIKKLKDEIKILAKGV